MKRLMIVSAMALTCVSAGEVQITPLSREASFSKNTIFADESTYGGYIFAYGGGAFLNNGLSGLDGANVPLAINSDDGFILGGGFGIRYSALGGFRFEWEHLYSELSTNTHRLGGVSGLGGGDLSFSGTYANLLKEIHFDRLPSVTGYVGVGIGYAEVDLDHLGGGFGNLTDSDNALSYQLITGVDFDLRDNLALFLQYKAINIAETDYTQNPPVTTRPRGQI